MKNLFLHQNFINTPLQPGVTRRDHTAKPFQRFLPCPHSRAANHVKYACLTVSLLLALSTSAQNYSIDWFKVAGGGGTSTGGVYTLSGTIGQHDAGGPMAGGIYSLTGGFWALSSVQAAGAPLLQIVLTTTNTAVVYWPSPS